MTQGKTDMAIRKGRMLGRVDDLTWELFKAAAKASGMTFTDWAVDALTREAEKDAEIASAHRKRIESYRS